MKVTSSGGFWITVGVLLMGVPLPVFCQVLFSAAVHELGHWWAVRACGGRVASLELTALGAVMAPRGRFSYGQEAALALAGPGASFLLALGAWPVWPELAGASLALGLFNMLPAWPLDGGRVLRALLVRRLGPGERVSGAVTRLVGAGLVFLGAMTSPLLALWGVWLLLRRNGG